MERKYVFLRLLLCWLIWLPCLSVDLHAQAIAIPAPLTDRPEQVLHHTGYTLSYNKDWAIANWVAWELTREKTEGAYGRNNNFRPDPLLPAHEQVVSADYAHTGYDRGHMAPAADMKWSELSMRECFYMTNMCPQRPKLNQISWKALEDACRRWAKRDGSLYIVCGPVMLDSISDAGRIGKKAQILVPDAFYKVILSLGITQNKAIGFLYLNSNKPQSLKEAVTTVDAIEALTGIDFFHELPDELEDWLEANSKLSDWTE